MIDEDNLAYDPEDENDENECLNWVNNPIRQLFDNPRNLFHRSFLEESEEEEE
jgi:hypothetical protein